MDKPTDEEIINLSFKEFPFEYKDVEISTLSVKDILQASKQHSFNL